MRKEHYKNLAILIFASVMVFVGFGIAHAQASETFDISTFQPPRNWTKKASQSSIQISTEDKVTGAYCLITLFKSLSGIGKSKENFNAAWQTVVKNTVNISSEPQMFPSAMDDGWEVQMGTAPFEKDGTKGVAVLVTGSGYGKIVNALILTNTDAYEPQITAFLGTIRLKKPEAELQVNAGKVNQPTIDNPSGSQPSVTQFNWKQTQNRRDMGGYAGYSSNTYQFNANNTYKFSRVDFQNYSPKYYLENEEGTYKINGNKITITPRKAIFSSRKTKQEDPPLKSGNLALAAVQYSFEIMNLNNNLTLLLSPVDGTETKRDGTFSFWLNGEKRNTYSYNSVNAAGELIR